MMTEEGRVSIKKAIKHRHNLVTSHKKWYADNLVLRPTQGSPQCEAEPTPALSTHDTVKVGQRTVMRSDKQTVRPLQVGANPTGTD